MNMKQFSPILTVLIVATTPIHGAQQSFLQKWIVEPSQSMIKSPKTWAFVAGAALCYGAYKGCKKVYADLIVAQQAKELLRDEYYILPNWITIDTKQAVDVRTKDKISSNIESVISYIKAKLFNSNSMPSKMCICFDKDLSPADRLIEVLTIRKELLEKLKGKLGSGTSMFRWLFAESTKDLRTTLRVKSNRIEKLIELLKDKKEEINRSCRYTGTEESGECTSVYCLKAYKKTYSRQEV